LEQTEDFHKVDCLLLDFKPWALNNSGAFPVPQDQFDYWIAKFCVEEKRLKSVANGFINGKLV